MTFCTARTLALAVLGFLFPSLAWATDRIAVPRLELANGEVVDLESVGLGATAPASAGELWPFVVALDGEQTRQRLAALEAAGATLAGAIPPASYLVRARPADAARLAALPGVAAVAAFEPRWKLAPSLAERALKAAPGELLRVEIVTYADAGGERVEALVAGRGTKGASLAVLGGRVVFAELPAAAVEEIAALPEVAFVQPAAEGRAFNNAVRVVMQTDRAHHTANQAFYNPVYGIGVRGAGQLIAISDTGVLEPHEQFAPTAGKVKVVHGAPPCDTLGDPHSHGTAVASTLAGDGPAGIGGPVGTPNGFDGLAFEGDLYVQDIFDDNAPEPVLCDGYFVTTDLLKEGYEEGARVHNNSWGHMNPTQVPYGGSYGWRSRELDLYLKDPAYRDSVVVFAVGNEGGEWVWTCVATNCFWYIDAIPRTVSEEAHAKNVISVGGSRNGDNRRVMYLFSGRGPTNDCIPPASGTCATLGRIKPDLVAPASTTLSAAEASGIAEYCPHPTICPQGYFGTSHAAPAISAAAALVLDYFAQGKYPNDSSDPPLGGPPSSALVKAMLVNAAVFLTDLSAYEATVEVGGTTSTYPNYDQGFGRPALDNVLEPAGFRTLKVFEDATTEVATGDLWSRLVKVKDVWQAACNVLRVSLAWTDEPGTLGVSPVLVNDLDLEVSYAGQTWRGNHGLTGGAPDRFNNVEDVFVPLGAYTGWQPLSIQVRVRGHRVMSAEEQPFAVVLTYGPCLDTTPCKGPLAGGCYQGPGDTVPGSKSPPGNGFDGQKYSMEECVGCGEGAWPTCNPPPAIRPIGPIEPGEPVPLDPHG